jgi:hypothetical protein
VRHLHWRGYVLREGDAKDRARHIGELERRHVAEGRKPVPVGTILRLARRAREEARAQLDLDFEFRQRRYDQPVLCGD